jgi:hypothetical protein
MPGLFDDLIPSNAAPPPAAGGDMFADLIPKKEPSTFDVLSKAVASNPIFNTPIVRTAREIGGNVVQAVGDTLKGAGVLGDIKTGQDIRSAQGTGYMVGPNGTLVMIPSAVRPSLAAAQQAPSPVVSPLINPAAQAVSSAGQAITPTDPNAFEKIVGGAAKMGAPLLSPETLPLTMGMQGAGSAYEAAKAKGASDAQAQRAGGLNFTAQLAAGALPVGRPAAMVAAPVKAMLGKGLIDRAVGATVEHAVAGAGLGAASKTAENVAAMQSYDPNRPIGQGVPEATVEMAIAGPAFHAVLQTPAGIDAVAKYLRRNNIDPATAPPVDQMPPEHQAEIAADPTVQALMAAQGPAATRGRQSGTPAAELVTAKVQANRVRQQAATIAANASAARSEQAAAQAALQVAPPEQQAAAQARLQQATAARQQADSQLASLALATRANEPDVTTPIPTRPAPHEPDVVAQRAGLRGATLIQPGHTGYVDPSVIPVADRAQPPPIAVPPPTAGEPQGGFQPAVTMGEPPGPTPTTVGRDLRTPSNLPVVSGPSPIPSRMSDVEIAQAQRQAAEQPSAQPPTPDRFAAPEGRLPQTPDQTIEQRQAQGAFDLAGKQRHVVQPTEHTFPPLGNEQPGGPDTRDTQAGGLPKGPQPQTVLLHQGFPVTVIDRGPRGAVTVQRYDPRTGELEPGSEPFTVQQGQLDQTSYMAEPRRAQDFTGRANAPRTSPEIPDRLDISGRGPGTPVTREPTQTYRTTDNQVPQDQGPPFPEQATGPGPFPNEPRAETNQRAKNEEELRQRYERAQRERAYQDAEQHARANPEGKSNNKPADRDAEGRFPVTAEGYVKSQGGGPIVFPDHVAVAKWITKVGHVESPDQIFDVANHPTVKKKGSTGRQSEAALTVIETGRRAKTAEEEAGAAPHTDTSGGEASGRSGTPPEAEPRGLPGPKPEPVHAQGETAASPKAEEPRREPSPKVRAALDDARRMAASEMTSPETRARMEAAIADVEREPTMANVDKLDEASYDPADKYDNPPPELRRAMSRSARADRAHRDAQRMVDTAPNSGSRKRAKVLAERAAKEAQAAHEAVDAAGGREVAQREMAARRAGQEADRAAQVAGQADKSPLERKREAMTRANAADDVMFAEKSTPAEKAAARQAKEHAVDDWNKANAEMEAENAAQVEQRRKEIADKAATADERKATREAQTDARYQKAMDAEGPHGDDYAGFKAHLDTEMEKHANDKGQSIEAFDSPEEAAKGAHEVLDPIYGKDGVENGLTFKVVRRKGRKEGDYIWRWQAIDYEAPPRTEEPAPATKAAEPATKAAEPAPKPEPAPETEGSTWETAKPYSKTEFAQRRSLLKNAVDKAQVEFDAALSAMNATRNQFNRGYGSTADDVERTKRNYNEASHARDTARRALEDADTEDAERLGQTYTSRRNPDETAKDAKVRTLSDLDNVIAKARELQADGKAAAVLTFRMETASGRQTTFKMRADPELWEGLQERLGKASGIPKVPNTPTGRVSKYDRPRQITYTSRSGKEITVEGHLGGDSSKGFVPKGKKRPDRFEARQTITRREALLTGAAAAATVPGTTGTARAATASAPEVRKAFVEGPIGKAIKTGEAQNVLQALADHAQSPITRWISKTMLKAGGMGKAEIGTSSELDDGVAGITHRDSGKVTLRDDASSPHDGMNEEVASHEIIHSFVTSRYRSLGSYLDSNLKLLGFTPGRAKAAIDDWNNFHSQVAQAIQEQFPKIADGEGDGLKPFHQQMWSSPDELLSWSLTNVAAQDYLKGLDAQGGKIHDNMFTRFVDSVAKFFGIYHPRQTALARALDLSGRIFEAGDAPDFKFSDAFRVRQTMDDLQAALPAQQKLQRPPPQGPGEGGKEMSADEAQRFLDSFDKERGRPSSVKMREDVARSIQAMREALQGHSPLSFARATRQLYDDLVSSNGQGMRLIARAGMKTDPETAQKILDFTDKIATDPGSHRVIPDVWERAVHARTGEMVGRASRIIGGDDRPELHNEVADILAGRKAGVPGSEAERMARELRGLFDAQYHYMTGKGLSPGYVREGYFPRVIKLANVRTPEQVDGFLKSAAEVYRQMGFNGGPKFDREGIGGNGGPAFEAKTEAQRMAEAWYDRLIGGSDAVGFGGNMLHTDATRGRVLPKSADTLLEPYLEKDLHTILGDYFHSTSRAAETASRFGPNGEKVDELLHAMRMSPTFRPNAKRMEDHIESATGYLRTGKAMGHPILHNLQSALAIATLLPNSTWSSLSEGAAVGVKAHNPLRGIQALVDSFREMTPLRQKDDAEALAHLLGAVEDVHTNRFLEARAGIAPEARFMRLATSKFFRATGLSQLTRAQQIAAVRVGKTFIANLAREVATNHPNAKSAADILADHGVSEEGAKAIHEALGGRTTFGFRELTQSSPAIDAFKTAVRRFAVESVQSPTLADKPKYANHPWGRAVYQIQSFNYSNTKNILAPTYKNTRKALDPRNDYSMGDRARMLGSLTGLITLMGLAGAVSWARDKVTNPQGQAERTPWQQTATMASRANLFGNYDQAANTLSPFLEAAVAPQSGSVGFGRYASNLGDTLLGPYRAGVVHDLSDITGELQDVGQFHKRPSNTLAWKAAKATTHLVGRPIAGAAASLVPEGSVAVRLANLAAMQYLTSPQAASDAADAWVGQRTNPPKTYRGR